MKIKKGDNVIVLAGKNKGEKGKVGKVFPETNRVIVEGVNKVKRHKKARTRTDKGEIIEIEAALHVSNVALVDPKGGKATRIGYSTVNGKKTRVAKKSGQELK